ncbi:porin [Photobacterium sanctipauli]|uniref:Porin n=1 Tax=Photobacterium sanctipauli TaxID=1342794 RepID=A0A2T3NUI0_9GAMM|nr:porin [Photobacterium sanctipauli]PSW19934.1 porin [Photobacterium sanctipauli]
MKKSSLSIIIPLTLLSTSAFAAEIYRAEDGSVLNSYGRAQADFKNAKQKDENGEATGERKTNGTYNARLGFNGRQVINDTMAVMGQAQYQLVPDDKDNVDWKARYIWAGIDMGEYGRIEAGRVVSGLTMFTNIGDIFSTGGDPVAGFHVGTVDESAALVFRQNGTFQYRNNIGNLDYSAAYITNSSVDYAYNAAAQYSIDLGKAGTLHPVVMYQKDKAYDKMNDITTYETYGIGTQYFYEDLYLGAAYTEENLDLRSSSKDASTIGLDFRAMYTFGDWVARIGYRYLKFDETKSTNDVVEDAIQTELQYRFTPRTSLYLNYTNNRGGKSTVSATGVEVSSIEQGDVFTTSLRFEW